MDVNHILGYVGALLTGMVLGLLGGGGALLSVPTLTGFFGLSAAVATGYSLFLVGVTASSGAVQNIRKKMVDFSAVAWYGIPSLITVFCIRRFVLPAIPQQIFTVGNFTLDKNHLILLLLSVAIFIAAYKMIFSKSNEEVENEAHSLNHGKLIVYAVLLGTFLGMVGAGGGFLMTPALMHYANLNLKKAIGTSLVLVAVNSLVGFLGDLSVNPHIDWLLLATFSAFSITGVFIGHALQSRVPTQKLRIMFGWTLVAIGVYMVFHELLR
ncbi:MAG: sulfite exporter TauE/SafE family protein [Chitinophagales bacterium]